MISHREAWVADRIRKTLTFLVSAGATWLLLRVLFRLARGQGTLWDPELGGFLALAILSIWWIRSTRRMPRRQVTREASVPETSASPAPSDPRGGTTDHS